MFRHLACLLIALTVAVRSDGEQIEQPPIVGLARAYVERFIDALSKVVAEERYSQEAERPRRTRTLRSDFIVARDPGATRWYTFREVLDVRREAGAAGARGPARPVDGRSERRHAAQGAGDHGRGPPLQRGEHRDGEQPAARHELSPGGIQPPLSVHRRRPREETRAAVRKVSFEEVRTPTVLTVEGNRDLPADGVMWIDEGTGRILKTELRLGEKPAVSTGHTSSSLGWAPATTIATTFGVDEPLGIDVPLEMRDRYPFQRNEIKGVATYGLFRRLSGRSSR